MPNHLIAETSPYLQQHAHQPVDWFPWGPAALEKALREDKPIFLSIGYAACHWCHVMAHESFDDPAVAAYLNQHFVSIKVDREERPDLDSIYMNAVVLMTRQGGWPLSVFLTPDGQPFYGGTYFPPTPRYNLPSFGQLLQNIHEVWERDRAQIDQVTAALVERLRAGDQPRPAAAPLSPESFLNVLEELQSGYDWDFGGWNPAPRFPAPMTVELLIRLALRGRYEAMGVSVHLLQQMAKGGLYDLVGGGFHRYSTDDRWLVPHFEKMLYDNAQLALAYLHAYLAFDQPAFREICTDTLDFVLREMTHPLGGFYSSLDADSQGEEGKFYAWDLREIQQLLAPQDLTLLASACDLPDQGNFDGRIVLQRVRGDAELADLFQKPAEQIHADLRRIFALLRQARAGRVRPGTDDKVLTGWNALMLTAFAEAGRYLKEPRYLQAAVRAAEFLLQNLFVDGKLVRSWRDPAAVPGLPAASPAQRPEAVLEDYAALILALTALYQSDPSNRWFLHAAALADAMLAHFGDPAGGFFDTRDDSPALLLRPKNLQDNAVPSGNALASLALLQLAALTGSPDYRAAAEGGLRLVRGLSLRHPLAFAQWLCAEDFLLGPVSELAVLAPVEAFPPTELLDALWSAYRPRLVAAVSPYPPLYNAPALLHNRSLLMGRPAAYICQNFTCRLPVAQAEDLLAQLDANTGQLAGRPTAPTQE